jgi:hypothetical protein
MGRALTLCFVATLMTSACDRGSEETKGAAATATPSVTPTSTEVAGCDLRPPRRVRRSVFKPSVVTEGGQARLRVRFVDGSRATLTYPKDLRLIEGGARPDTTGGEPGGQMRPQISYGGIYFRLRGEPRRCLETHEGSLAGVWRHPDGEVLILRFGKWFVSVFATYTELQAWAGHLRGRVTRDGWLILKGDRRLKVGPEQRYGDTSIMLGDLEPGGDLVAAKLQK